MTALTCNIPNCPHPQHGRAMCRAHYMKWWRGEIEAAPPNPRKTLSEVFWSKVDRTGECWLWQASTFGGRYGQFRDFVQKKNRLAHRVAYELEYGSLDDSLVIDHLCRTTLCVRPSHLEQVTYSENTVRGYAPPISAERMKSWSASRTHCKWEHELTPANTYVTREGWRQCRTCRRIKGQRRNKKGRVNVE